MDVSIQVERRRGPPADVHEVLARYEDELEEAAKSTDDPAHSDVFEGLAAMARGEPVPDPIRRRVTERGGQE